MIFFPNTETKTRIFNFKIPAKHCNGGRSQGNDRRKHSHADLKRRNKLSLFANDIILYVEALRNESKSY